MENDIKEAIAAYHAACLECRADISDDEDYQERILGDWAVKYANVLIKYVKERIN
jgi:hypothetical protein